MNTEKAQNQALQEDLLAVPCLGPVGMLAGGLSAKNKGIYQVAIRFKDGQQSLVEVDDKIYKAIVKNCF